MYYFYYRSTDIQVFLIWYKTQFLPYSSYKHDFNKEPIYITTVSLVKIALVFYFCGNMYLSSDLENLSISGMKI